MTVLCKDCRWYRIPTVEKTADCEHVSNMNPKPTPDYVHGKKAADQWLWLTAQKAREHGACGPHALHFAPRLESVA